MALKKIKFQLKDWNNIVQKGNTIKYNGKNWYNRQPLWGSTVIPPQKEITQVHFNEHGNTTGYGTVKPSGKITAVLNGKYDDVYLSTTNMDDTNGIQDVKWFTLDSLIQNGGIA